MKENSRFSRLALIPVLALGLGLASCEEDTVEPTDKSGTFFGDTVTLGNGIARSYVVLDADGDATEVGLRLSEASMTNLPTDTTVFHSHSLALPDVDHGMVIDHIMLDWSPVGHEPKFLFGAPHFDMHFFMMTESEVHMIDTDSAKAHNVPAADYIPAGYITPPPAIEAVPMMGVHWIDPTDPTFSQTAPVPFTEVMIYGTWDGDLNFIEPMMTREWLMTKPTLTETLKLPAKYQQSGLFPTTYSVKFDATAGEYVISLGGMTERTAS